MAMSSEKQARFVYLAGECAYLASHKQTGRFNKLLAELHAVGIFVIDEEQNTAHAKLVSTTAAMLSKSLCIAMASALHYVRHGCSSAVTYTSRMEKLAVSVLTTTLPEQRHHARQHTTSKSL